MCAFFDVDPAVGLSDRAVAIARRKYGPNEIPAEPGTPFWKLVLKQFDDLLVKILIAAAIVSLVIGLLDGEGLGALVEPGVIVLILVANAAVGVATETNAERAIEELKAYQADVATVMRDGRLRVLPASELVPGDVVDVAVGCKVPADARLLDAGDGALFLRVDQSILTGESGSVEKSADVVTVANAVAQDKRNVAFGGTVVTAGRARGVVVSTGAGTAVGKISDALCDASDEEEMTPLKKKLDEFGTFLSKVIAVVCVLVWVVNIAHFADPAHGGVIRGAMYYFKIAVALAVAAIPEGLPAVVTTCLALGTRKMAKQNAIVRTLPSVETLGCTSVICSDKTGTLTTNAMTATRVCVVGDARGSGDLAEYAVDGVGYEPNGVISSLPGGQVVERPAELPAVLHLAICASLCNDGSVSYDGKTRRFEKIGESTEAALRALAEKIGLPGFDAMPSALRRLPRQERAAYCATYWGGQFARVAALEFSRDRKLMSVLASRKGQSILFTKGAPEAVLRRCATALTNEKGAAEPMTDAVRDGHLAAGEAVLLFPGGAREVWEHLAPTTHTTATNRSVPGKLNAMADDFNNFYGDLEEETTIRKQAEEQRVVRMERELGKIENVLATETKRRIEASKALQTMFEAKVQALLQAQQQALDVARGLAVSVGGYRYVVFAISALVALSARNHATRSGVSDCSAAVVARAPWLVRRASARISTPPTRALGTARSPLGRKRGSRPAPSLPMPPPRRGGGRATRTRSSYSSASKVTPGRGWMWREAAWARSSSIFKAFWIGWCNLFT